MILVTTETIAGARITETLGLVRGSTIRARHIGGDIMAGLKTIVGGELHDYTKMLAEAREQALDRMTADAVKLGADAILAIRYTSAQTMQSAAEIVVYGTAVKIAKDGA